MRNLTPVITLGLGGCLVAAAIGIGPAASAKTAKMTKAVGGNAALIAHGKALTASLRCNMCHGGNLAGRPGRAPSLHTSGVLREYNAKTWARVMDTGVTNDGGQVHKPMPVYHLKAADSGALYAYLKTLK